MEEGDDIEITEDPAVDHSQDECLTVLTVD